MGLRVLHVDDDEIEREAMRRSLNAAQPDVNHSCAIDGLHALAHMRATPTHRPDLVLLDWQMPHLGGEGFLAELRADPQLSNTPVIVLSTSDDHGDVAQAYRHKAAAYVTKRDAGNSFEHLIELIEHWAEIITPPVDDENQHPSEAG